MNYELLVNKTNCLDKKYIPTNIQTFNTGKSNSGKQPKGIDKIIENQFRFHYDTVLIKKNPHVIKYNDLISITEKVHGTSGISAYVLCKQPLTWKQKLSQSSRKSTGQQRKQSLQLRTLTVSGMV